MLPAPLDIERGDDSDDLSTGLHEGDSGGPHRIPLRNSLESGPDCW
jgi:hypothetical protein